MRDDDYVRDFYAWDLDSFRSGFLEERHARMCDCEIGKIHERVRARGLHDPRRFTIILFLEATLLAGVHAYDRAHFIEYRDTAPWTFTLERHHLGGVRAPQAILSAFAWDAGSLSVLVDEVAEFARVWGESWNAMTDGQAGTLVVACLSSDADLSMTNVVPAEVRDAYRRAFEKAAQSLVELEHRRSRV